MMLNWTWACRENGQCGGSAEVTGGQTERKEKKRKI